MGVVMAMAMIVVVVAVVVMTMPVIIVPMIVMTVPVIIVSMVIMAVPVIIMPVVVVTVPVIIVPMIVVAVVVVTVAVVMTVHVIAVLVLHCTFCCQQLHTDGIARQVTQGALEIGREGFAGPEDHLGFFERRRLGRPQGVMVGGRAPPNDETRLIHAIHDL